MLPLNEVFLHLPKRAERGAREDLINTFVDVGPLSALLASTDHQIIYGRRGTGKTHALSFLAGRREEAGDITVLVDLRNIGSAGGLYADGSRPIHERATSLLMDVLATVHELLLEYRTDRSGLLDVALLDELASAISQVRVIGTVEAEGGAADLHSLTEGLTAQISGTLASQLGVELRDVLERRVEAKVRRSGTEQLYLNFGSVGAVFRKIAQAVSPRRIWILLDEWSSLPPDLQPYLAELLKRSVLPIPGITVKIAAIEHRSQFLIHMPQGGYVGIEIGSDMAADVNLDDFMVFDNDSERAKVFFQDLIYRHAKAVDSNGVVPSNGAELVRRAFTQVRAFEEFVRAAEGVPRDAINLLSMAAQRALDSQISVEDIRVAARHWYQRDKERTVSANADAYTLLHYIIDTVIGERRARAFLLRSGDSHQLIDILYDSRVLHILKRNISTHDQPGVRYDVYKLDYGCYVDLLTTQRAPLGLLNADGDQAAYVEVPPDDYRSIRRAILDLNDFGRP